MWQERTREIQDGQKKTEVGTRDLPLKWEVFVTPGIPTAGSDLAPGAKQLMWPLISSTLISGKRDAVLVDTFITVEQADILVDWVAASGKNLTTHKGHIRYTQTDSPVTARLDT